MPEPERLLEARSFAVLADADFDRRYLVERHSGIGIVR